MNVKEKLSRYLPEIGILFLLTLFIYFHGLFLPFFLSLIAAYAIGDKLKMKLRFIKNWELRLSLFLLLSLSALLLFLSLSTNFIIRDVQRFSASFNLLWDENQDQLDAGAQKVKTWVADFYDPQELEATIKEKLAGADSLGTSDSPDLKALGESLQKIPDLFKSKPKEDPGFQLPQFSFWYQVGSFFLYLVLILYNYNYFDKLRNRYQNPNLQSNWKTFWDDFDRSFVRYFKLRTKIVLWLLPIFALCFIILDLPGTYLYLLALVFLLYIPYFQYFLLIPIALSTLVLSTEISLSYWWIIGIISFTFILASIVEEVFLIPRIMEANIGLNPVLMVLGLSFWTYTLGTTGVLIGIPLSSLAIIYLKRFILPKWFPQKSA